MSVADGLSQWPAWRQRALALLILAVGATFFWLAIARPMHWILGSQSQWRSDAGEELAAARGKVAREPKLRQQLADVQSSPLWQAFYTASDPHQVTPLIERDLSTLAAAAGTGPLTFAPLSDRDQADYQGRGVRLTGSMTAAQLRVFAAALRASTHFLRVERLIASTPQKQERDSNPSIAVTMEVYGYLQPHPATGEGR